MAVSASLLLKIWTVAVLFFVNVLNYMDRYTIAGILPELQNKSRNGFNEAVDDTEGGLLQTAFIVSYMALGPLFGYLGDRFTRKYIMAAGVFVWSAFVLASSFSVNYAMLIATRSGVGIGEASYATVSPAVIADLFPAEKRLRVLMVYFLAVPIGSALGFGAGSFVSSQIYQRFHYQQSWRWALRVSPGLGVIAVLLTLFSIREPPRGNSEIPNSDAGVKGKSGFRYFAKDVICLLKNKTFMLLTFGFAALTFSLGALGQWAPTLVYRSSRLIYVDDLSKAYSVSQASIGFGIVVMTAGFIGTVCGSELSKFINRWTDKADCIVCAIGLLVGGPMLFFALVFGAMNLYLGWILVFIVQVCFCMLWAPIGAILLYVVIPERRSTAVAVQILIIHLLGDASSPFIVGAISDAVYHRLIRAHNEIYSQAVSLQYALYSTIIVTVIGGGLFLMSTLTVLSDRKAVQIHVKRVASAQDKTKQEESLNSNKSVALDESSDEGEQIQESSQLIFTKATSS